MSIPLIVLTLSLGGWKPCDCPETPRAPGVYEASATDMLFAVPLGFIDTDYTIYGESAPLPPPGCKGSKVGARCKWYYINGMIPSCEACVAFWCAQCYRSDFERRACMLRNRNACISADSEPDPGGAR